MDLQKELASIWIYSLVVLFVLAIAVVVWSCFYSINPEGLQYIGIARLLKSGAWSEAVSGTWGPLLSWLTVVFGAALPELFAIRLIVALGSLLTPFAAWFIIKAVISSPFLRHAALVTVMFMPIIVNSTALITPDTLLSILVLLGFYCGIKFTAAPN